MSEHLHAAVNWRIKRQSKYNRAESPINHLALCQHNTGYVENTAISLNKHLSP